MNVISRGIKNAFRSPLRSCAIIFMLAISIGLILAMLVARSSINQKIASVNATTGTSITINPAGISGDMGGGNPLTTAQVTSITNTPHITQVTANLTDQLTTSDTNLVSSLTLGSFGRRQESFSQSGSSSSFGGGTGATMPAFTPHISVTGTNNPASVVTGSDLKSGALFSSTSSSDVAVLGSALATKNNLTVGKTFTAYSQTFTVVGIYTTGTTFQNSGLLMPLATVQTLSTQPGAVSAVTATVDSASNVTSTVSALKTKLGSAADITSQQQEAQNSVSSLQAVAQLALYGVIGAAAAGAVIILLSMIVIVRERRREIGIIKAIGGKNSKVIVQFMSEALTLTIVGSIVGLIFGVIVSGPMTQSLVSNQTSSTSQTTGTGRFGGGGGGFGGAGGGGNFAGFRNISNQLGSNVKTVSATLTPQVFFGSIGIILLIAIIGSAVPAWLIAHVRPAEVLRSE